MRNKQQGNAMNSYIKYRLMASFSMLLAAAVLSGCAAAVIGGAAVGAAAVHDRRSVGTVIDDQTIELVAKNSIYQDEAIDSDDRVKVVSFNGIVLLVGEASSAANKSKAAAIAGNVDGVRRVFNELDVQAKPTLGTRFDDSVLTVRINGALLSKNPVEGFDPNRVKVITVRDTAYLMGLLTRDEADAVTEVARNVRGVGKVVKLFEYQD